MEKAIPYLTQGSDVSEIDMIAGSVIRITTPTTLRYARGSCSLWHSESSMTDRRSNAEGETYMPKVVRFDELGGPDVFKIEEETSKQPGKGEVRLQVRAVGLNRAELMFVRGQ